MKKTVTVTLAFVLSLIPTLAYPSTTKKGLATVISWPTGANALCNDKTYWFMPEHRGACSHHGGVLKFKP